MANVDDKNHHEKSLVNSGTVLDAPEDDEIPQVATNEEHLAVNLDLGVSEGGDFQISPNLNVEKDSVTNSIMGQDVPDLSMDNDNETSSNKDNTTVSHSFGKPVTDRPQHNHMGHSSSKGVRWFDEEIQEDQSRSGHLGYKCRSASGLRMVKQPPKRPYSCSGAIIRIPNVEDSSICLSKDSHKAIRHRMFIRQLVLSVCKSVKKYWI